MIDEPVTDIVFVSEKENCPEGYKLIEKCPCGHEAQLWEKVLGGHSGERFLCFTKQAKDNDLVIEDMYIPSRSAQYLYKGYKIIKQSVEGDEPMYHKQLAVKKVPRSHANKVIADIIICRSRDNVSKMYKKLDKVNGLCICFRQVDVGGRNTPSPKHTRRATTTSSSPSSPSSNFSFSRDSRGGSLKIGDVSRNMAGMKLNEPSYRRPSGPSLPLRRSVSPLASHSQVSTSPSPQPPSSPPHGEATALHSPTLHSPPSPPPPNETTDSNGVPTAPPTVPLNTSSQYPQPPTANTTGSTYSPPPPSVHSNSQYPPPQPSYPPPATNYPPPSGGSYQSTYPPPPPAATMSGPPAAGYGGGGSLGFGGLGGGGGGRNTSYPPHPPPSQSQGPPPHGGYGGYGAIAGSSFVAAPMAPQGGGSAPYNPYSQQPQGQMMSPYPNPPGQRPPTAPPASSFQNYGFKF